MSCPLASAFALGYGVTSALRALTPRARAWGSERRVPQGQYRLQIAGNRDDGEASPAWSDSGSLSHDFTVGEEYIINATP